MEIHSQFFSQHNIDAIDNRVLVVPTQRLASELESDWGQLHLARGDKAWPMLKVMPWPRYIEQIANEISEFPLISPTQRQYLWQRVTDELMDERDDILSSRTIIATWLQDAEGLIVDYALGNISDDRADYSSSQQFDFVMAALERASKISRRWQRSRIADLVIEESSLESLAHCWQRDKALWVGFEQLTPLQQKVGSCLNASNVSLPLNNAHYDCYPLLENELDSVLLGASEAAREDKRIAIVVADLARSYPRITERISLMEIPLSKVHITASAPLAEHPVIKSLMRHLKIVLGMERDVQTIIAWYSDELVEAASYYRRMRYFANLNDAIVSRFDLPYLNQWLNDQNEGNEGIFAWAGDKANIERWRSLFKGEGTITRWNEALEELLVTTGWAADVVFNSEAIQATDSFHTILRGLIDIDVTGEPVKGHQYISLLQQSLMAQPFQAKQDPAPISISGWREIAGLNYDSIYVIDQHSISWPPTQSPNPLLPLRLQKKYAMNGLDSADSSANELIERLALTGSELRFSYSLKEGDEERQSARQLVNMIGMGQNANLRTVPVANIETREYEDQPLAMGREEKVRGVAAINSMFNCPFIAMADQRLNVRYRYPQKMGISPLMIGKLVDKTLQYLVPQLKEIHNDTLDKVAAESHVENQLKRILSSHLGYIGDGQIKRASERILQQAIVWIKTYDALYIKEYQSELAIEGEIGGLAIRGRIDRKDEAIYGQDLDEPIPAQNGVDSAMRQRIIDYKSGSNNGKFTQNMWLVDKLKDLQLPIYAILSDLSGEIGIAHISLSDVGWYSQQLDENTKDQYRTLLNGLASEFMSGEYSLRPKSPNSCKDCHYELLCRRDIWLDNLTEDER